jgi:hypothetical protein
MTTKTIMTLTKIVDALFWSAIVATITGVLVGLFS